MDEHSLAPKIAKTDDGREMVVSGGLLAKLATLEPLIARALEELYNQYGDADKATVRLVLGRNIYYAFLDQHGLRARSPEPYVPGRLEWETIYGKMSVIREDFGLLPKHGIRIELEF